VLVQVEAPPYSDGGRTLSDADSEMGQIVAAARGDTAVRELGTQSFEAQDPYELKVGRPEDAAMGLTDRKRVDPEMISQRIVKGADDIEEAAAESVAPPTKHCEEVHKIVDYCCVSVLL
jgi:hypothetical protein